MKWKRVSLVPGTPESHWPDTSQFSWRHLRILAHLIFSENMWSVLCSYHKWVYYYPIQSKIIFLWWFTSGCRQKEHFVVSVLLYLKRNRQDFEIFYILNALSILLGGLSRGLRRLGGPTSNSWVTDKHGGSVQEGPTAVCLLRFCWILRPPKQCGPPGLREAVLGIMWSW